MKSVFARVARYTFLLLGFVCIRGESCSKQQWFCTDTYETLSVAPGQCAPLPSPCWTITQNAEPIRESEYEITVTSSIDASLTVRPAGGFVSVCAASDAVPTHSTTFDMQVRLRLREAASRYGVRVHIVPRGDWSVRLQGQHGFDNGDAVLPGTSVYACPVVRGLDGLDADVWTNSITYYTHAPRCTAINLQSRGLENIEVPPIPVPGNLDCGPFGGVGIGAARPGCYLTVVTALSLSLGERTATFEVLVPSGPVAVISFDEDTLRYPNRDIPISGLSSGVGNRVHRIRSWAWTVRFQPPGVDRWFDVMTSDAPTFVLPEAYSGTFELTLIVTDAIGRTATKTIEVDTRG